MPPSFGEITRNVSFSVIKKFILHKTAYIMRHYEIKVVQFASCYNIFPSCLASEIVKLMLCNKIPSL